LVLAVRPARDKIYPRTVGTVGGREVTRMSSMQDFLKKAYEDPALQKELRAKLGDPAAGIPAQDLAAFAAGKGYKFSVDELKGDLSDDQLGSVSGGLSFKYRPIKYDLATQKVYLDYAFTHKLI
jgi:predicted ribosomally synthesized peptide with nif11-like leader